MRFSGSTVRVALAALATLSLFPGGAVAQGIRGPSGQLPLAPTAIPQFVQALPLLSVQNPAPAAGLTAPYSIDVQLGNAPVNLSMCEFDANVLPPGTLAPGVQTPTRVWGYSANGCPAGGVKDTYIGPVIVAFRGTPTPVTYTNALPTAATTGVLAWKYSTDQTLHWADPFGGGMNNCMMAVAMMGSMAYMQYPQCAENYSGPIPVVPHLHGGEVPPEIDGQPEGWFTSDGSMRGHKFYTQGVAGEVAGLPALPTTAFAAGNIVYDSTTKGWFQLAVDALGAQSWTPYQSNAVTYVYPNTQEAAPIWFHDHTLGATRLNVYAGMAGAYYVVDPTNPPVAGLPTPAEVVPLVIQDRQFDTNGQLFFQAGSNGNVLWSLNPEHPYWSPEFVGDAIVVNGKAWPFAQVDAKRYRFLILNGSNARTYELFLVDQITKLPGPSMWVVANDGGYLDTPQEINPALGGKLVIMPGERYEVIIDFSKFPGTSLLMRNTARTPYPFGATVSGTTLGRIVQFRVNPTPVADASYDPATLAPIRTTAMPRLASAGALAPGVVVSKTRQLTLNEVMGMPMTMADPVTGIMTAFPGGPLEVLVNNTKWSGFNHTTMTARADFQKVTARGQDMYFSETPVEGETEVWEIVNLTADAHPIHLHLVQFQILNRQNFQMGKYNALYNASFPSGVYEPGNGPPLDYNVGNARALGGNPDVTPFLQGPARPAGLHESGWKDTVVVLPGQVTRIAVRWAPTDAAVGTPAAFPFDPSGKDGVTGVAGTYNFVWHCHIIDHEDNEMMRPDYVIANPTAVRTFVRGPLGY